jgi:phenylpropionate dioxygenase-like ring-hydroxylating dioxygenase large terminal subunit
MHNVLNDYCPGWYAVLSARELPKDKPVALQRFGLDLVAFRSSEGVHLLADRCPHRGVKLSGGTVAENCITCPFHGFSFTGAGNCTRIPANGPGTVIPKGMQIRTFTAREAHGFVFMWWGEAPAAYPPIDWFTEELQGYDGPYECIGDSRVGLSRNIENQLDAAHLPFVHKRTIGRFVKSPVMDLVSTVEGNRIRQFQRARPQAYIELRLPNLWLLRIGRGACMVAAFAPLTATSTRLYLRYYQNVIRIPVLKTLFGKLMSRSNKRVLEEDFRVIHTHDTPISPGLDGTELLQGFDAAVINYRRLRERWQ